MPWTRPIATIDAETDPFSRKRAEAGLLPWPFVWGFYDAGVMDDSRPFYYFTDTDEFVDWIRTKEFVVYAHNGGKFDYHYLKHYIEEYDELTVINGRLAKFRIGCCEFRDSWNILPVPLAMYEKQEQDFSLHEEHERHKPENWKRILEYLESDCVNLYEIVSAYRARFGTVLTQASGAMRELDKKNRCPLPQSQSPQFYDEFKPYYFGGRVECFRAGVIEKPFQVVDINSAYPFAMLHEHPYGFETLGYGTDYKREDFTRREIETSFYTVRARSRGAFPWRDDTEVIDGGALIFPNDDELRTFNITGWELLAAEETGTVSDLEILQVHQFLQTTDFREFIETLYEERQQAKAAGDKATNLLAKLAMNASYGRFAMNPRRFRDYQVIPESEVGLLHPDNADDWLESDGRVWEFAGHIGDKILASAPIPEKRWRFYNVATSASITGFVRAYLWRAIHASQGVFYCDTDSIAAETPNVQYGPNLGQWEREGDFTRAAIAGKKLYAFWYCDADRPKNRDGNFIPCKVASKGVKLNAMEIEQIARGETVTYVPMVPTYRVSGFVDKETGDKEIARYIPRTVKMLERTRRKIGD